MSGLDTLNQLRSAGFSDDEVEQYQTQQMQQLTKAGFSQDEINAHFGVKAPDASGLDGHMKAALEQHVAANTGEDGKAKPLDFAQALDAGWQGSVTGLIARGKAPDVALDKDAPWYNRLAANAAQMVGDAPAMLAGALAGGAGGVETGPGALVTATAGAFAVPTALRMTMMDAYQHGNFKSFSDFWDRFAPIAIETAKSYITGAATGAAGGVATKALAGAAPVVKTVGEMGTQLTTMVTVGKALEGKVPEPQDFLDAATVLLGAHVATGGGAKLMDIYRATGVPPAQVALDARVEPTIQQDLADLSNKGIPSYYHDRVDANLPPALQSAARGEAPTPMQRAEAATAPLRGDTPFMKWLDGANYSNGLRQAAEALGIGIKPGTFKGAVVDQIKARLSVDIKGEPEQVIDGQPTITNSRGEVFFNTRGADERFHGTGAPIESLSNDRAVSGDSRNIYGQGFYTTDAADISAGYMRKGGTGATLYKVDHQEVPLYDMEKPLTPDVEKIVRGVMGEDYPVENGNTGRPLRNLREVYDEFRAESKNNGMTRDDVQEVFDSVRWNLEQQGFRGFEHIGGGTLGSLPHNVKIFWHPEDDVKISPANIDAYKPTPEQKAEATPTPRAPEPGSIEDAQKQILDKISVQGGAKESGMSWDKFYTAAVDKLDPLRRAADAVAGEKNAPAIENPYKLMRLVAGVQGKAQQFLENGAFDFKTLENTGPSLKEIVSPFKDDLDGFRAYMASRRAVELEGRGINSGMPADAARQVIAAGGAKYEAAFQKLQEYQDSTTRYLRDAGVLSDEAYAAMKEANKAYVPFNRVMDDSQGFGIGNRVRNPIKAIKGSERDVIDPLETIVRNTYSYMNIAERNNVARTFYSEALKTEDPSQYFEPVAPSLRATTATDPEMAKFLKANGIDAMPDAALTVFRAMRTPLARDEVGFFDDGQYKVMKVDPDVAEAFNGTPPEQHGLLFKLLSVPAKLFRAGLVVPEFIMRHLLRNQIAASTLAEHGNVPFWDTFKGLVSVLGKDEDYQNWLKSGGAMISAVAMDRDNVQVLVREIAGQDPAANFLDKAWNIAKTPMDVLHAVQNTLENSTRVGAFKRALGDDTTKESILDAGFSSRNIAPDPARMGEMTRNWNAITALFNIEIQHTDQLVTALRDRPLGTMAKIFAGVTLPSVLLWLNNHDKDEWREAHQWERDAFWLVPMNGVMLRIPKPFLLGTLFGSSVERLLDGIYGNDGGRGAKEFAHSILEQGIPHLIPNAITPALEQITNYSFFKGGPLVPDRVQKLLPEYRYTEYSSELTKALGHIVGMVPYAKDTSIASPIVIQNYVSQWTGGAGVYALQLADSGLRKAGVLPDPVKPADTLADIPLIKAFVVRYPSATAESIQHFHDQYAQRKMVFDTFTELAKRGDEQAAMEVMKANPTAMMKLDGIEKTLGQQNSLVRMIYRNPDIPGDQKRQLIDATYYQMIQISHMGNELIKQVDAAAPILADH